jgi:hypothetical protein
MECFAKANAFHIRCNRFDYIAQIKIDSHPKLQSILVGWPNSCDVIAAM